MERTRSAVFSWQPWRRVLAVFAALTATLTLLLAVQFRPAWFSVATLWALWATAAVAMLLLGCFLWRDFIRPSGRLRRWALRVHAGELSTRITAADCGGFSGLCDDLNTFSAMLEKQSRDTEVQLQKHAGHLTEKTRSLALLYHFAASINTSHSLDELLDKVLKALKDIFGIGAATIRRRLEDGRMQMLASSGLPGDSPVCSEYLDEHSELLHTSESELRLTVPMQYRGKTLGVCSLYLDRSAFDARAGMQELFTSLGRHLGMAIEKAGQDDESKRLSIIEERTRFVCELHDSLAQTIASLRFQVRALDQALHQQSEADAWQILEQVESSVDAADVEVRGLMRNFRAPADDGTLLQLVQKSIARFRDENCSVEVFFQKEWPDAALPDGHETQVLRIIQEAMTNAGRHGRANCVRILMRGGNGRYRVLVEDNGVGVAAGEDENSGAGHFGLAAMHNRAERINGRLSVDSEPGEGTRVTLAFEYPPAGETR